MPWRDRDRLARLGLVALLAHGDPHDETRPFLRGGLHVDRAPVREDDFAAGFVFDNPNAKGACGCGESFTV